jgi:four helix bundle protein
MSFEFRDLDVYKNSKQFYSMIQSLVESEAVDKTLEDQLLRAALSISLNIAEGYGRFHPNDKKNFYITSRASVNECVACLDLYFRGNIPEEYLVITEEIAKMLSGLIKSQIERR